MEEGEKEEEQFLVSSSVSKTPGRDKLEQIALQKSGCPNSPFWHEFLPVLLWKQVFFEMVRSTVLDSSLVNSYVAVDHFMYAELMRDTSTVLL